MFDNLSEKLSEAFKHLKGDGKIGEKNIEDTLAEVKAALLDADVNFKVVKEFVAKVKQKAMGHKVIAGVNPGEQFVKIMHDELTAIMGKEGQQIDWDRQGVTPVIIVGLNGAGKTTFSAKLANYVHTKHRKDALLVPADTFRPAAKKQLQTLAKSIATDCYDSDLELAPGQIARAALEEAKKLHKDVVIIDTAGRLHVDDDLMAQLKEVKEALADYKPEVLFVADAMTGQEAVSVAKVFHQAVDLSGVVLSKMDSDARGGAALSIRHATGIPIRFISLGEKMKDLELFHPDRLAKRILDMGDVLSLVEKAEEVIDEKEAEKMVKKMRKNRFTIDDFVKQMEQIGKLGSMGDLLKMIPGMGGAMRQMGDLASAEGEMKKIKVMISSMTQMEREDHNIINSSRIKRVAKGSGTTVQDVEGFLQRFEQMRKMMAKMLKGGMMGGLGQLMSGGMPAMPGARKLKAKPGIGKASNQKVRKRGPFGGGYFSKKK